MTIPILIVYFVVYASVRSTKKRWEAESRKMDKILAAGSFCWTRV